MNAGVFIGTNFDEDSIKNFANAICTILEAAANAGTQNEVICKALECLTNVSEPKGCIVRDTSITMNDGVPKVDEMDKMDEEII